MLDRVPSLPLPRPQGLPFLLAIGITSTYIPYLPTVLPCPALPSPPLPVPPSDLVLRPLGPVRWARYSRMYSTLVSCFTHLGLLVLPSTLLSFALLSSPARLHTCVRSHIATVRRLASSLSACHIILSKPYCRFFYASSHSSFIYASWLTPVSRLTALRRLPLVFTSLFLTTLSSPSWSIRYHATKHTLSN